MLNKCVFVFCSFDDVKVYLQQHLSAVEHSNILEDRDKSELYSLYINCLEVCVLVFVCVCVFVCEYVICVCVCVCVCVLVNMLCLYSTSQKFGHTFSFFKTFFLFFYYFLHGR